MINQKGNTLLIALLFTVAAVFIGLGAFQSLILQDRQLASSNDATYPEAVLTLIKAHSEIEFNKQFCSAKATNSNLTLSQFFALSEVKAKLENDRFLALNVPKKEALRSDINNPATGPLDNPQVKVYFLKTANNEESLGFEIKTKICRRKSFPCPAEKVMEAKPYFAYAGNVKEITSCGDGGPPPGPTTLAVRSDFTGFIDEGVTDDDRVVIAGFNLINSNTNAFIGVQCFGADGKAFMNPDPFQGAGLYPYRNLVGIPTFGQGTLLTRGSHLAVDKNNGNSVLGLYTPFADPILSFVEPNCKSSKDIPLPISPLDLRKGLSGSVLGTLYPAFTQDGKVAVLHGFSSTHLGSTFDTSGPVPFIPYKTDFNTALYFFEKDGTLIKGPILIPLALSYTIGFGIDGADEVGKIIFNNTDGSGVIFGVDENRVLKFLIIDKNGNFITPSPIKVAITDTKSQLPDTRNATEIDNQGNIQVFTIKKIIGLFGSNEVWTTKYTGKGDFIESKKLFAPEKNISIWGTYYTGISNKLLFYNDFIFSPILMYQVSNDNLTQGQSALDDGATGTRFVGYKTGGAEIKEFFLSNIASTTIDISKKGGLYVFHPHGGQGRFGYLKYSLDNTIATQNNFKGFEIISTSGNKETLVPEKNWIYTLNSNEKYKILLSPTISFSALHEGAFPVRKGEFFYYDIMFCKIADEKTFSQDRNSCKTLGDLIPQDFIPKNTRGAFSSIIEKDGRFTINSFYFKNNDRNGIDLAPGLYAVLFRFSSGFTDDGMNGQGFVGDGSISQFTKYIKIIP